MFPGANNLLKELFTNLFVIPLQIHCYRGYCQMTEKKFVPSYSQIHVQSYNAWPANINQKKKSIVKNIQAWISINTSRTTNLITLCFTEQYIALLQLEQCLVPSHVPHQSQSATEKAIIQDYQAA